MPYFSPNVVVDQVDVAGTGNIGTLAVTGSGTVAGDLDVTGDMTAGTVNGVKVYQALITQASTSDPVVSVLHSDLGTVTWARADAGNYTLTSDGEFTEYKTAVLVQPSSATAAATVVHGARTSDNVVTLLTFDATDAGSAADAVLTGAFLQIMVFS